MLSSIQELELSKNSVAVVETCKLINVDAPIFMNSVVKCSYEEAIIISSGRNMKHDAND